jgi:hypothetical protein
VGPPLACSLTPVEWPEHGFYLLHEVFSDELARVTMSEAQGEFPSQATSVYTSVIVDPGAVHESDLWNAGLAQPAPGVEEQIFGARRTAAAELP